jgi:hypothetical protein
MDIDLNELERLANAAIKTLQVQIKNPTVAGEVKADNTWREFQDATWPAVVLSLIALARKGAALSNPTAVERRAVLEAGVALIPKLCKLKFSGLKNYAIPAKQLTTVISALEAIRELAAVAPAPAFKKGDIVEVQDDDFGSFGLVKGRQYTVEHWHEEGPSVTIHGLERTMFSPGHFKKVAVAPQQLSEEIPTEQPAIGLGYERQPLSEGVVEK